MNKKTGGLVLLAIVVIMAIYAVVTYNGLVGKDEIVKNKWSEVNSAYQRRTDLIPNLVTVVKGAAKFEQSVLVELTEARAKAANIAVNVTDATATNIATQNQAQAALAGATSRLLATIEKYPELRGTEAFAGLQVQLEGTERRIKVARKDFNEVVAGYNSSVRSFPTSLVAGMFGFASKEGFIADAGAEKAVEVNFGKK
jgi:LemA protein